MTALPLTLADYEYVKGAALPPDLTTSLVSLLDTARRNLHADQQAAEASIARATSLLQIELERKAAGRSATAPGSLAGWQVHRVKAYVDSHLETPIHIRDLARVAQRSGAYFCRAFKRTFGETPHAFIVSRRLHHASLLMLTSDMPLSEVAVSCGFHDQAHLSKVFRAGYGQSPAAWRRERRDLGCQIPAVRRGAQVAAESGREGAG